VCVANASVMFLYISTDGGPLTWISIALSAFMFFGGGDILVGAGSLTIPLLVVLAIVFALGAYRERGGNGGRFRDALRQFSLLLPPYIRDLMYSHDDSDSQDGSRDRSNRSGARDSGNWSDIAKRVRATPIENYCSDLKRLSAKELKQRLQNRGIDVRREGCVEKSDLLNLLVSKQKGTTDSCIICFENFEEGDPLRVLSTCGHTFHLECIDRWAFVAAGKRTEPQCPLCKEPIQ